MVNVTDLIDICAELSALRYYPSEPAARLAIVRLVASMVRDIGEARWLVTRMTNGLYAEWPGPQELRACFCSKFKPRDGINAISTVYLDGIPSERKSLPPAARLTLPPGAKDSEDIRMDTAVKIASATIAAKDRAISGPATEEEIAASPEWLRRLEGYE